MEQQNQGPTSPESAKKDGLQVELPKLNLLDLPRGIPGINPVDRYKFLKESEQNETPASPEPPKPDIITNSRPKHYTSRPERTNHQDTFKSTHALTYRPPTTAKSQAHSGSGRTRWIRMDRKVLRFYMFFKEAIHESPIESYRVRKCTLLYYLASDKIQVNEPRIHNSGLMQGAFLHKIDFNEFENEDGSPLSLRNLLVGKDVKLFGRRFRIYDCDAYTRSYFKRALEILQPSAETAPLDPVGMSLQKKQEIREQQVSEQHSRIAAKQHAIRTFFEHDDMVLRFIALWDDRASEYGALRKFTVCVYPEDNSLSVRECKRDYGENDFRNFVKRTKVPKPSTNGEFYVAKDFVLGSTITINKRDFVLVNCGTPTKEFFKAQFGIEQIRQSHLLSGDEPEIQPQPLPDKTERNFWNGESPSLIPKICKPDLEGHVLKFETRLETELPQEKDRRFVVSFFLVDETLAIFEPEVRNTGFVGGKYLERGRYTIGDKEEFCTVADIKQALLRDRKLEILKKTFIVSRADAKTNEYFGINQKTADETYSQYVLKRIVNQLLVKRIDIRSTFRQYDTTKSNCLSIPTFKSLLENANVVLPKEDLDLVISHFAYDGSNVWYIDFCDILATKWAPLKVDTANRIDVLEQQLLSKLRDAESRIRKLFRKWDKDSNGHLTFSEFQKMVENYNISLTPYEMAELMARYDLDKRGTIDYNEFCDKVHSCDFSKVQPENIVLGDQGQQVNLEDYLKVLKDREDHISKVAKEDQVLQKFCKAFGQKRYKLRQTFREVDMSGDGKVSMEEFIKSCDHVCTLTEEEKDMLSKKFFPNPEDNLDYEEFLDAVFYKK